MQIVVVFLVILAGSCGRLAAVQSAEEVANSRMAINTDNEIYSYHALDAMDHAAVAAADMLKAIVAAASF